MADDSSGGDRKKGFGGFGDLVSDVSKDIESATRESSNPPIPKSEATVSTTGSSQNTTAQTEVPRANKLSSRPSGGSSGAKWFWGIGIVMVILISIGNSGKEKSASHTPSPAYLPPPTPKFEVTAPNKKRYEVDAPDAQTAYEWVVRYAKEEEELKAQHSRAEAERLEAELVEAELDAARARAEEAELDAARARAEREAAQARARAEAERLKAEQDAARARVDLRGESAHVKDTQTEQKLQKSDNQPKRHEEARSSTSLSDKRIVNSSHKENYARCSDGRYSSLCLPHAIDRQ